MKSKALTTGYLLAAIILLQALFPASAGAQKAMLNLDTTSIRIGEQVGIKLNATLPRSARIYWPAIADTFTSQVEILNRSKVDTNVTTRKDFLNYSQSFTITSFDTGFHYIPPFPVYYSYSGDTARHQLLTDGVFLNVRTVEVDTTRAIRDIKANLAAPVTFGEIAPLLLVLLVLAAMVALVWYYIWRRKSNKPLFPVLTRPQGPPWETALQMLNDLKNKQLWQNGKVKEYYTELTDILRIYLEKQHGIEALEMVSSEIIDECSRAGFGQEPIHNLNLVLERADFAKFAKAQPQRAENEQSMGFAFNFVEATKPGPEADTSKTTVADAAETAVSQPQA